jgi:peptidoglycan/xylan/chitin deacetylase (PgdA/CDA1 family)
MTASQLKSVAATEFVSVGNHTLDHPDLSAIDKSEAHYQIAAGRRQLEAVIDHSVDLFSYPYGSYSNQTFDQLRPVVAKSHDVAVTAVSGHVGRPHDPLQMNRTEAPVKMKNFEYRTSKLYGTLARWHGKYIRDRG